MTCARTIVFVAALALATGLANAADPARAGAVGQVTHLSGALVVRHADGTVQYLSEASVVNAGDTLATQDGAYARVKFADGAEVVLRPSTQLRVVSYRYAADAPAGDDVELNLLKGGLRKVTGAIGRRNRARVRVTAPNAAIGMLGTHFGMLFCRGDCDDIRMPGGVPPKDGLHLDVAAGALTVSGAAGTQRVSAGQFAFAPPAAPPAAPPRIVPPAEGIQVTMPPAIARNRAGSAGPARPGEGCPTQ